MKFPIDDDLVFATAVWTCGDFLNAWKYLSLRFAVLLRASHEQVDTRLKKSTEYRRIHDALVARLGPLYRNGNIDPSILSQSDTLIRELAALFDKVNPLAPNVARLIHQLNNSLAMLTAPQSPSSHALKYAKHYGIDADLKFAYEAMRKVDVSALKSVFKKLDKVRADIATSARAARRGNVEPNGQGDSLNWHVFIIEDDRVWASKYRRGVEAVRDRLRSDNVIELEKTDYVNRQDAEAAITTHAKKHPKVNSIVILNLGLPGADKSTDMHDEGIALLKTIHTHCPRASVIVVTAPHNSLVHQLQAFRMAANYLIKGADTEQQLREAIWNLMSVPPDWQISLNPNGRIVRLKHDGEEAEFTLTQPQMFDLLLELAKTRSRRLSKSHLEEALVLAREYRNPLSREGNKNASAHDAVSRLRKELRARWEENTGKQCHPEFDILTTTDVDGESYYQLVATLEPLGKAPEADTGTIMIVEDQPEVASAIANVLDLQGYRTIIADSVNGAIQLARKQKPWLVCLDIQLPMISGGEAIEPDGGLKFLEGLDPHQAADLVKVVFSGAVKDDSFRARAERFGLRPYDFIPKISSNRGGLSSVDTSALVIKVFQKEKEAMRRARYPALDVPFILCVHLPDDPENLKPQDLMDHLRVDGNPVRPTSRKAAALLLNLLCARTDCVPPSTLYEIYMDATNPDAALNSAIQSLRKHIAKQWLAHLPADEQAKAAHQILKCVGKEGFRLIVRVL